MKAFGERWGWAQYLIHGTFPLDPCPRILDVRGKFTVRPIYLCGLVAIFMAGVRFLKHLIPRSIEFLVTQLRDMLGKPIQAKPLASPVTELRRSAI